MKFTIASPLFLPSVEYFIPFINCDSVLFADHLQFVKRSSITRSFPIGQGICITIPVKHTGDISTIKNKGIASIESWNSNHLKSIYHVFNKYPFFEDYYFDISQIFQNPKPSLGNFLADIICILLAKLKINAQLESTQSNQFSNDLDEGIINFSENKRNPEFIYQKEYEQKGWLNISKIKSAKIITHSLKKIKSDPLLNISILDFLFYHGPQAAFILRELQGSCFVLN